MAAAEGACCGFGIVLRENEGVGEGEIHGEDEGVVLCVGMLKLWVDQTRLE